MAALPQALLLGGEREPGAIEDIADVGAAGSRRSVVQINMIDEEQLSLTCGTGARVVPGGIAEQPHPLSPGVVIPGFYIDGGA